MRAEGSPLFYASLHNPCHRLLLCARCDARAAVFIGAVIISLYVGTGDDFDFLINISAALFMWCGLPAFGAMAYMPSIIGGEPGRDP